MNDKSWDVVVVWVSIIAMATWLTTWFYNPIYLLLILIILFVQDSRGKKK